MYVVVHKGEHYVGGTEAGVQFLKDCGTYVPYSFLGYLSAKESGMSLFLWYYCTRSVIYSWLYTVTKIPICRFSEDTVIDSR